MSLRCLSQIAVTVWATLLCAAITPACSWGQTRLIIVVGAPGQPEYASQFQTWARRWLEAVESTDIETVSIGVTAGDVGSAESHRQQLQMAIENSKNAKQLWLVLIGHGTFDGQKAKFNLPGPDFSADELAEWLSGHESTQVVVNCAAASGPFINALSAPQRIVVTSTKSGYEHNFSRFGDYLSQAISETGIDLDKDGETSLLEAVLAASQRVAEFYAADNRLATEHALVEDNHDGLGTPTEWFRGVRAVRRSKSGQAADGTRANQMLLIRRQTDDLLTSEQIELRNKLELDIENLRNRKSQLTEDDYYRQLETVILQLAELYAGDS